MSKVKVVYYGLILSVTGNQNEEVHLSDEATVKELLHSLVERHGNAFRDSLLTSDWQLQPLVTIELHGCDISDMDGLNTKLEDNAELTITLIAPMISGG